MFVVLFGGWSRLFKYLLINFFIHVPNNNQSTSVSMKSADVSSQDVDRDRARDRERTRANEEAGPESGGGVPSLVITGATEQVSGDRKA